MARRPSKREIQNLIEAFGKYYGASEFHSDFRAARRLYSNYMSMLARLSIKYPDVDFGSDEARDGLEERAKTWWRNKAIKGAGVDW